MSSVPFEPKILFKILNFAPPILTRNHNVAICKILVGQIYQKITQFGIDYA